MRYLLLIYNDETQGAQMSPAEQQADYERYGAFTQEVTELGVYKGGEPLHPTNMATTVRVRNGQRLTADGPFAETKEQLGGYYLLDCKDLDQAITLAAKIPAADYGCIEIRPIMEFD